MSRNCTPGRGKSGIVRIRALMSTASTDRSKLAPRPSVRGGVRRSGSRSRGGAALGHPVLEGLEVEIDHWGEIEREQLRDEEPPNHCQTERPARLAAGA